jgi:hypothetical protein
VAELNAPAPPMEGNRKDFEKMGGPGSGRWRGRGRETVEAYRCLDVNRLSMKGYLRPGLSSVYHWNEGSEVASIKLHAEAGRLQLSYCVWVGDDKWKDVAEIIPIVRVPCRLGGSRSYFICPGFQNGRECGRRVAKLYVSKCYFLCRHCNRLAYASQYEQPWQRARRRANKLWQRLGIDSGIAGTLPEKRKGRSARIFARLLEKTLEAEILADEACLKRLQWLAQIDTDIK